MRTRLVISAVAAVVLFLTASAYTNLIDPPAPVTFTLGNCGVGVCGETDIHFGPPAQGPTMTVTGHTVDHGFPVDFTTTSTNMLFASGGSADLDPCNLGAPCPNGLLHSITITVPSGFFEDYILNPTKLADTPSDLMASVTTNDGSASFGPWGSHMTGQNYLTIRANPGVDIFSVTITSVEGFGSLAQNRISGAAVIPEPSSMLLLGTGLLLFTQVLRRKLKLSKGAQEVVDQQ